MVREWKGRNERSASWGGNVPSSDAGEVIDGVGAIGGLHIGGNLVADRRINCVVDEVEVEALCVGAGWS